MAYAEHAPVEPEHAGANVEPEHADLLILATYPEAALDVTIRNQNQN